ncbi:MAG: hypothetical protein RSG92_04205 [Pseudomonas sp.]
MDAVKLEREIQQWLETLGGKESHSGSGDLYSVIRYSGDPLSKEMMAEVEGDRREGLSPGRGRATREACRVLRSLYAPRFYSANTNISSNAGEVLKPDLVLEDEISSAFVIVEIKRSRQAAREFATELLAYKNCLCQRHPGSNVFFILVSTSWAPLEQHAFDQLTKLDIPTLPLEYRAASLNEPNETLWVRSDLFPSAQAQKFQPEMLQVETKVFSLPKNWFQGSSWNNQVDRALNKLSRDAQRGRVSGFMAVWSNRWERSSREGGRLYFSMAVRNAYRPQEIPVFRSLEEEEAFAWSNTYSALFDDAAIRHLSDLELAKDTSCDSPESEGTWDHLQNRLNTEETLIWRFVSFGDIGDHINDWRDHQRYSLAPIIPDTANLPSWHPITWLPVLDTLIDRNRGEEEDTMQWRAFHTGTALGKLGTFRFEPRPLRHFAWGGAQARFLCTWNDLLALLPEKARFYPNIFSLHYCSFNVLEWQKAVDFALDFMREKGDLASYCFILGFLYALKENNIGPISEQFALLREKNLKLPESLETIAREVEDLKLSHRNVTANGS